MKKDEPDVSLKINGKHVKKKTRSEQEPTPSNEFSIIDWNERRAAEKESAADQKTLSVNKRPGLPLKKIRRKKKRPRQTNGKKNQPFSVYFISLTAGAAALGLLFGIMLLQFVSAGDSPNGSVVEEEDQEPPPITAEFNDTLTMFFVQAGAFTNKAKGVEMQNNLTKQGFPGVLTYDGDLYYLFSGVSFQEEDSQRLLNYFEEEQIEVYEKTRTVPDPEETEGTDQVTDQLLHSKQILKDTASAVLEDNGTKKESVLEEMKKFMENTKSWEEKEFVHLRDSIGQLEKKWKDVEDPSSDIQELLIESVLYYEEAVYARNGVEEESE
ncbi:hypothetical protein D7Z54_14365 [Salibacterium salarium]|uniref:SPOR domain-containing protein n=1 Tax=Salibacterium salarium TaxID=284579 RepID=A0A428N2G1_9BACI|nr:hypothetical protein [Salibacterium salarium]RSL32631.1 hypothetical protein D7Z54_14365 [Salibacterium salarium]